MFEWLQITQLAWTEYIICALDLWIDLRWKWFCWLFFSPLVSRNRGIKTTNFDWLKVWRWCERECHRHRYTYLTNISAKQNKCHTMCLSHHHWCTLLAHIFMTRTSVFFFFFVTLTISLVVVLLFNRLLNMLCPSCASTELLCDYIFNAQ